MLLFTLKDGLYEMIAGDLGKRGLALDVGCLTIAFPRSEERIPMLLHIALQDGFFRDSVRIVVSGREVFSKSQVTTRQQTGYADSVEVDSKELEVSVDISLPERDIAKRIAVTVTRPTYVGVSLTSEDEISWKISADPFGYL